VAVSGVPNMNYVLKSLYADLARIDKPDFFTSLKGGVKEPSYPPRARRKIFEEDSHTILAWVDSTRPGETQSRRGEDRLQHIVYLIAIVKQDRELQAELRAVCDDIMRVIRTNPERNWPTEDGSANTWGIFSAPIAGKVFDYSYHSASDGTAVGIAESFWKIEFRRPTATG